MEENKVGICCSCGMAVKLPHECTEDNKFLGTTDWMVTRHRDQKDMGVETSLTDAEFAQLLSDRQSARSRIAPQV